MSVIEQDASRIITLEKKVKEYFESESTEVIIEFQEKNGKMKLNLITINPKHDQSFLFHSTLGIDKVDAMVKMWDYVKDYKAKENSYTIQWKVMGMKELQTSYFSAKNIYEALDKLNYGRDMSTLMVFSIVLNPVS